MSRAASASAAVAQVGMVEEASGPPTPPMPPVHFDKTPYHVAVTHDDNFPMRDVHVLDGVLGPGTCARVPTPCFVAAWPLWRVLGRLSRVST